MAFVGCKLRWDPLCALVSNRRDTAMWLVSRYTLAMAVPLCDECKAIYRELVAMVEMSRHSEPGPGAPPQQMAAWFDQRETDENYNMRMRPAMWALGRRLMEHQIVTGHTIPPITPLGGPPSRD
jgi:hypothetical protein